MAKPSIMAMILLFSMLFFFFFFHAKGQSTTQLSQLNSTNDFVCNPECIIETWYNNLHSLTPVTTKLLIFFHATNKVNQIKVAQSLIPGTTPPFFGDTYACDYQLTAEQDINSESLGNGQGFFLESSRADFSALLSINLVLKGPYFSGSTLTLIGQDRFNDEYRELSIVGGTGDFRLATGTASMFNVYRVTDVAIVRLTLFVRHYGMASAPAPAPAYASA